jgi:phenylpropionate dioxygenase-like ring-hydroxylating dioxygenase large terminal subunit
MEMEVRAVLSAEDNDILTRVGLGTPMGNLLRRYWIPACLSSEIGQPDGPPAPARADQRLHLPRVDDHRADPVLDPADLRGAVR